MSNCFSANENSYTAEWSWEKWFISLQGPKYKIEMKGSLNLMELSAKISEHLNIVEVKCQDVDERVLKVLKFLSTFNICKLTCNFPGASIWKFTTKLLTNKHQHCVDVHLAGR